MAKQCAIHNCQEEAEWSLGSIEGIFATYCSEHKEYGEAIIMVFLDANKKEKKRGSSLLRSDPNFASDKEKLRKWIKKTKRKQDGTGIR